MWLFTKDGFFSVVQKLDQKGTDFVTVRSRHKGDLVRFLKSVGSKARIATWEGSDYQVRAIVNKSKLKKYMSEAIDDIDYSNFKHEVELIDPKRAKTYLNVWDVLFLAAKEKISNCFPKTASAGYFDDGGIWRNRRNF